MRTLPHNHARYEITRRTVDITFLRDIDGYKSVTNDAEWVVERLYKTEGNKRFVYQDSQGEWDELEHDSSRFTGFRPYRSSRSDEVSLELSDMEMKI